ncbi:MAG: 50S ribosomal protein L22 [Candidatus Omnitrophica bacterium]|nr:50S ribosomal protein L22 [Candidatus Omnitrophota bacterium]
MMGRAILKYAKIPARKARLVVDVIRGKRVDEVIELLPIVNKKAAPMLLDLVKSAVANVKVKYPDDKYTDKDLYISKITADGASYLARFRAASMGRATMIRRRTSHLTVELTATQDKLKALEDAAQKKTVSVAEKISSTVSKTVSKRVKKSAPKEKAAAGSK